MSLIPHETIDTSTKRRADALAEINKLNTEHMLMADELASAKQEIQRLQDKVAMLESDRREAKREANIYMRKTVELATAMTNISLLCRKGEEVVMSAGELLAAETDEDAAAEKASAANAVAALPKRSLENIADNLARDLGTAPQQ